MPRKLEVVTVVVLAALLPVAAVAQGVPTVASTTANLPHDLSPMSMFLAADPVVKAIITGLLLASVATWTVWIAKIVELGLARRQLRDALADLKRQRLLVEASSRLQGASGMMSRLIAEATAEVERSADIRDKSGVKDRIASLLHEIETEAGRSMRVGMGLLATVGSTAPFVGLFGTVWGIMNSFIGIAQSHTTNLAVVAPGIAEALLATAVGLFAAIPAVLIYNGLARSIVGYRALVRQASSEVLRLVSRDLDRMAEQGKFSLAVPGLASAPVRKQAAE